MLLQSRRRSAAARWRKTSSISPARFARPACRSVRAPSSTRLPRSRRRAFGDGGTSTPRCMRSSLKNTSTACCSIRRFAIFWKRNGLFEKLIAMMSPQAPASRPPKPADAGASRVADALFKSNPQEPKPVPSIDLDARFTDVRPGDPAREGFRPDDRGRDRGGAQGASRALRHARRPAPDPAVRRRRRGGCASIPAASFRRSLQPGGAIDLDFRSAVERARRSSRSATFPAR